MFLLAQEGPSSTRGLYDFTPYHFGPCSFDLYRDLDRLEDEGLIQSTVRPGYTWKHYSMTPAGEAAAARFAAHIDTEQLDRVKAIRSFVATRAFRQLLKDVYARYPAYATNSVVGRSV